MPAHINANTIEIAHNQPQSLDYEERSGNLDSTRNGSGRRCLDGEAADLRISTDLCIFITSNFLGLKEKYLI